MLSPTWKKTDDYLFYMHQGVIKAYINRKQNTWNAFDSEISDKPANHTNNSFHAHLFLNRVTCSASSTYAI
jgi:hypothetical protein